VVGIPSSNDSKHITKVQPASGEAVEGKKERKKMAGKLIKFENFWSLGKTCFVEKKVIEIILDCWMRVRATSSLYVKMREKK
jgi:hypothetical protein